MKELDNQVKTLVEQGLTDKQIAAELGLLRRRVSHIRKDILNLPPNNPDKVILDVVEIKELAKTLSFNKIGKIKGCSAGTINNFAKKHGIKYIFNNSEDPSKPHNEVPTKRQHEILVGCLLGDGCMQRRKKTPMFTCDHGEKQNNYCHWKYLELKSLRATYTEHTRKTPDPRNGKCYSGSTVSINANTNFHFYYDNLYLDGKRRCAEEMLKDYSALSMAVHFMDDGWCDGSSFVFGTMALPRESVEMIKSHFFKMWGIETTISAKNNIRIRTKSKELFKATVVPYMLDFLLYKLRVAIKLG